MNAYTGRPKTDLRDLLTQEHPHVDLQGEQHEHRKRQWSSALANWLEHTSSAIANSRDEQLREQQRLTEKIAKFELGKKEAEARELQLTEDLGREEQERQEAQDRVEELKKNRENISDQLARAHAEISRAKTQANDLEREYARDQDLLEKHRLALHGQYEQLSGRLGCSIEGVGPDTILVLFTSVDPKNRAREFSFVLDFSTDVYRVLSSDPVLPGMGALLEEANTTGDLWPFFVRVRIAFATMVNGN